MRRGELVMIALGCVAAVVVSACSSNVPPGQFFGDGRANAQDEVQQNGATGAAQSGAISSASPGSTLQPGGGSNPTGPGGSGGSGGGNGGGSQPVATAGVTAGNCAGLRNGTGITDKTITVANVADLTGPVPGLFTSAQQAALAFAAYFNSTSTICGRKLKVASYDSETSSAGDQQADTQACGSSFAMVGSMGAFDAGGTKTVTDCGIPDLRAIPTSPERVASPVVFGTDAAAPDLTPTSQYNIIKSLTGNAYKKSAMLYLNAGSSTANALSYKQAMQSLGYNISSGDTIAIDPATTNYAPYASKLKADGVTLVQFEGTAVYAVRLMREMRNQNLKPVFIMDSVAYDPVFVASAGHELDGMYSYIDTAMFEEASRVPEMQLYLSWLHRVAPNAQPSFFGIFAWGAMRLFSQLAVQLGGKLNRGTFLAALHGVHGFTSNELFAPQDVGNKRTTPCEAVIQLTSSGWVRRSPYPWTCQSIVRTH